LFGAPSADDALVDVRLSEVVSALSHALDVTGGQPMGHAERSCLIGLRLAEAVDLESDRRSSLFYALLLKDAGCSTTAATTASVFGGDDQQVKRESRVIDTKRPLQTLGYLRRNVAPGAPLRERARHLRAVVAMANGGVDELERMRCERGAQIALGIGLDEDAAAAIGQLFEHWDGNGHPGDRAGEEISLLARMACLAQTMEFFWQQGGAIAACDVARDRRGTWFDPALVAAIGDLERDVAFWASLEAPDVQSVEPADRVERADDARLDRIAEAFASIVDAKSPFTARHSAGVSAIAVGIAETMSLDDATQRLVRRAGLLHDVGKLGVSNQILDKPGSLTPAEWTAVRAHPRLSLIILRRVPALADVAQLAAMHHERLDGSGYPYGLTGADLGLSARILQVADVADALASERPYRAALPIDEVLAIIGRDAGPRLDRDAFAALEASLPRLAAVA
jgi:HD-GYP domain-containing protein (c-di-GMP phosphodiesterase class II)